MREADEQAEHMFSDVSPEQRVPSDHPLRAVRVLTDEAVASLSERFVSLYATTGRPSIPPEQLLRVLALQVLYTHYRTQSERLLVPARSRSEMRLICSSLSRLEIIKERSRLFTEDWNRAVSRDICQWQPKTAHLWQPKTAHSWGGRLGRSGHSPGDARRAFWAGRRERSDRSPGQHAPRSCGAGGHVATPSRCSSDAVLSQC